MTPTELKALPYQQYLNSAWWKKRRAAKIESVGGLCERCQVPYWIQVHHVSYDRKGEELDQDLQVLCKDCHREEHGLPRLIKKGAP